MEISNRAHIAIGLMTELAMRESRRPLVLASVARKLNSSTSHLESITARLRERGLVAAIRGPRGGYTLSRDASEITVLEIILAAEMSTSLFRDVLSHRLNGAEADDLTQRLLEKTEAEAAGYLSQFTLSDLVMTRSKPPAFAADRTLDRWMSQWSEPLATAG
jgi:Rrf2 family transcriptional regulator, iron-sulfur cluster assembly transcription factor